MASLLKAFLFDIRLNSNQIDSFDELLVYLNIVECVNKYKMDLSSALKAATNNNNSHQHHQQYELIDFYLNDLKWSSSSSSTSTSTRDEKSLINQWLDDLVNATKLNSSSSGSSSSKDQVMVRSQKNIS